jgi:uncharacterized membrane protein YdcZ (DUF606 family)
VPVQSRGFSLAPPLRMYWTNSGSGTFVIQIFVIISHHVSPKHESKYWVNPSWLLCGLALTVPAATDASF